MQGPGWREIRGMPQCNEHGESVDVEPDMTATVRSMARTLEKHEREKRQGFTVTLVPEPGVDAIRSLRWILKRCIRQYGMRCVDLHAEKVTPIPPIKEAS
jgi:hypothetical protein